MLGGQSPVWIILPTIEAAAYSALVAYYDTTYQMPPHGLSWALSKIGDYSYSIYLLHPFLVFRMNAFVDERIMDISNFYVACAWSFVGFAAMVPLGYASYNFLELPFLRLRKRYVVLDVTTTGIAPASAGV